MGRGDPDALPRGQRLDDGRVLRLRLGPVVVEDLLTYRKELRLLEPFRVELAIAGITDDARKMRAQNRFLRAADGALCATVRSVVLWFDLQGRRAVAPPPELARLWLGLARTEDFVRLEG
jgi:acyl-CoA thioester hydrolase